MTVFDDEATRRGDVGVGAGSPGYTELPGSGVFPKMVRTPPSEDRKLYRFEVRPSEN
jgi:hypothetical protein